MNHPQANNLLDEAREGAAHSIYRITYALFITGDVSENELLRVSPSTQTKNASDNWTNGSNRAALFLTDGI